MRMLRVAMVVGASAVLVQSLVSSHRRPEQSAQDVVLAGGLFRDPRPGEDGAGSGRSTPLRENPASRQLAAVAEQGGSVASLTAGDDGQGSEGSDLTSGEPASQTYSVTETGRRELTSVSASTASWAQIIPGTVEEFRTNKLVKPAPRFRHSAVAYQIVYESRSFEGRLYGS